MKLGELAPTLADKQPSAPRREPIYSDDIPAAYVRFLYGLPDDYPVISRADMAIDEAERRVLATAAETPDE